MSTNALVPGPFTGLFFFLFPFLFVISSYVSPLGGGGGVAWFIS